MNSTSRLDLERIGVKRSKLAKYKADQLVGPVEDSYKPEHYRYQSAVAALVRARLK